MPVKKRKSKHSPFVNVIEGCGGYNSCLWVWTEVEGSDEGGFYEPFNTGFNNTSLGSGLLCTAILEAKSWAESGKVKYKEPKWVKEKLMKEALKLWGVIQEYKKELAYARNTRRNTNQVSVEQTSSIQPDATGNHT